jgi:hypothetical protein
MERETEGEVFRVPSYGLFLILLPFSWKQAINKGV